MKEERIDEEKSHEPSTLSFYEAVQETEFSYPYGRSAALPVYL